MACFFGGGTLGVVFDVAGAIEEKKEAELIAKAKSDIIRQFDNVSNELEKKYDSAM